jgi:hypothetical protein
MRVKVFRKLVVGEESIFDNEGDSDFRLQDLGLQLISFGSLRVITDYRQVLELGRV